MANNVVQIKRASTITFPEDLESLKNPAIFDLIVGIRKNIRKEEKEAHALLKREKHTSTAAEKLKSQFEIYADQLTRISDEIEDRLDIASVRQAIPLNKLEKICDRQIARNEKIIRLLADDIKSIKDAESKAFDGTIKRVGLLGLPVTATSFVGLFYDGKVAAFTGVFGLLMGAAAAFPKQTKQILLRSTTLPSEISHGISDATINSFEVYYLKETVRKNSIATATALNVVSVAILSQNLRIPEKEPTPVVLKVQAIPKLTFGS